MMIRPRYRIEFTKAEAYLLGFYRSRGEMGSHIKSLLASAHVMLSGLNVVKLSNCNTLFFIITSKIFWSLLFLNIPLFSGWNILKLFLILWWCGNRFTISCVNCFKLTLLALLLLLLWLLLFLVLLLLLLLYVVDGNLAIKRKPVLFVVYFEETFH